MLTPAEAVAREGPSQSNLQEMVGEEARGLVGGSAPTTRRLIHLRSIQHPYTCECVASGAHRVTTSQPYM